MRPALLRARSGIGFAADGVLLRIEIMRASRSITAGVYVLLGVYVSGVEGAWTLGRTWVGCLAAALVVAAAFVYNDVMDEHVDRRARPERPIPSGRLARAGALRLAHALAAAGFVAAWSAHAALLPFIGIYVLLSAWYSRSLKGTVLLGNAAVSVLVASLPVYGGVLAGGVNVKLLMAALMTFFFSLAQEILFTLEDIEGDRAAGLRTTATCLGPAASLRLVRANVGICGLVCLSPWYLGFATPAYAIAVVACTVAPALVITFSLRPDANPARIGNAADRMRSLWITSVLPLVLLR